MKPVLLLIFMLGLSFLVAAECNGTEELNLTSNSSFMENQTLNITIQNETFENGTGEVNISEVAEPVYVDDGSCDVSIGISVEKNLYESGERVKFYNTLTNKSHDFEIEYWIEDIFGDIVKKPIITKNVNAKSYTPKIKEKEKMLIIKNRLLTISCENKADTLASEFIFAVINPNIGADMTQEQISNFTQPVLGEATKIINAEKKTTPQMTKKASSTSLTLPEELSNLKSVPERNIKFEPSTEEEEAVFTSSGEKAKSKSIYFLGALVALVLLAFVFKNGIFTKGDHRSRGLSKRARRKSYGKSYGKAKG